MNGDLRVVSYGAGNEFVPPIKILHAVVLEYPEQSPDCFTEVQIPDGLDFLRRIPFVRRLVPANRLPTVRSAKEGLPLRAVVRPVVSQFYRVGDVLADYMDDRCVVWIRPAVSNVRPDGCLELIIQRVGKVS